MSRPRRRVERPWTVALRTSGVLVLSAWLVLPLLPIAGWAFADRWPYPAVLPTDWGVGGWTTAWQRGAGPAAMRSLMLSLLVAGLATPAGVAAGRALALGRVPFPRVVIATLFAPAAVPPFAVVMGLSATTLRAGVPGEVALIAVLVVAAIPYTTYVMRAAYAGYDHGFEDAARTLGASRGHVLWRIHLPLVAPGIATAAFLAFLVAWSDYVVTLILGAGNVITLPLQLGAAASGSGNDPTVAALALMTLGVPLTLLVATGRATRRRTAE